MAKKYKVSVKHYLHPKIRLSVDNLTPPYYGYFYFDDEKKEVAPLYVRVTARQKNTQFKSPCILIASHIPDVINFNELDKSDILEFETAVIQEIVSLAKIEKDSFNIAGLASFIKNMIEPVALISRLSNYDIHHLIYLSFINKKYPNIGKFMNIESNQEIKSIHDSFSKDIPNFDIHNSQRAMEASYLLVNFLFENSIYDNGMLAYEWIKNEYVNELTDLLIVNKFEDFIPEILIIHKKIYDYYESQLAIIHK